MRDIIKRRAEAAGLDGRYSGHSLRVGSAQSQRREGAELPQLMAEGRWERIDTMALYTRIQDAATGPAARYRYGIVPPGRRRDASPQRDSILKRMLAELMCVREELAALRGAQESAQKALARLEELVVGSIDAD